MLCESMREISAQIYHLIQACYFRVGIWVPEFFSDLLQVLQSVAQIRLEIQFPSFRLVFLLHYKITSLSSEEEGN